MSDEDFWAAAERYRHTHLLREIRHCNIVVDYSKIHRGGNFYIEHGATCGALVTDNWDNGMRTCLNGHATVIPGWHSYEMDTKIPPMTVEAWRQGMAKVMEVADANYITHWDSTSVRRGPRIWLWARNIYDMYKTRQLFRADN